MDFEDKIIAFYNLRYSGESLAVTVDNLLDKDNHERDHRNSVIDGIKRCLSLDFLSIYGIKQPVLITTFGHHLKIFFTLDDDCELHKDSLKQAIFLQDCRTMINQSINDFHLPPMTRSSFDKITCAKTINYRLVCPSVAFYANSNISNIHKCIDEKIVSSITIWYDLNVNFGALSLLKIPHNISILFEPSFKSGIINDIEWVSLIKKYRYSNDLLTCQEELIENGFGHIARI